MSPHENEKKSGLKVPNLSAARGFTQKGDPMILPPGIDSETFHAFITKAREICGPQENVRIIEGDDKLIDGSYVFPCRGHDGHAILDRDYFVASTVISPREVPEVQALMRLCNEYEVPVWPFSIGRNTGYGGAAPRVPGSVCMDLGKHMNRVLEVNTEGAFALVEPGVTFADLHEYLEAHNLREKVWLDVPDLGGGSIIGNAIERGVGYTPYGGKHRLS